MSVFRAAAGAMSAVVLALASAAGAAPLYRLLDLGTLNPALSDNSSNAYDVNELGQVVGSSFNGEARLEAFRTAPNAPINPLTDGLGNLGGPDRASEAAAINDFGQVVGWVSGAGPSEGSRAFFTPPNGRITSHMGTFTGGTRSSALAINDVGQIAGSAFRPSAVNSNILTIHAFRTSSSRSLTDADDLGTLSAVPSYDRSIALGINERGQVVGWSYNSEGQTAAFRTAANAPINPATDDLGTLGGDSQATAINYYGQTVGDSAVGRGGLEHHAFRTRPDAPINRLTDDLGTLGGARSYASDINDFGVVVGASAATADPDPPDRLARLHAFVFIDGEGMLDLNDLIVNPMPGWTLAHAEGINNLGQIVGQAEVSLDGRIAVRSFLLTPVPEPSLAGLVLAVSFVLQRRRRSNNGPKQIKRIDSP